MNTENLFRARRVAALVIGYPDDKPEGEDWQPDYCDEDEIRDVLIDLMHLLEAKGLPLDDILGHTRAQYERERDGEEG